MPTKAKRISKEKEAEKQSRNRKYKTLIKNQLRRNETYFQVKKTDEKELKKLISETKKLLDKAKNKKIIHQNKANREKRKLDKKLNPSKKRKEVSEDI